jgi:hypothetical protein
VDLACSSRKSTTKFSTAERRHQFTLVSTRSSSDLSPVSATPETDPTNQASYGNDHSSSFVPAKHCRLTPRTRRNFERKKKDGQKQDLGPQFLALKCPEKQRNLDAGIVAGAGPRTLTECAQQRRTTTTRGKAEMDHPLLPRTLNARKSKSLPPCASPSRAFITESQAWNTKK